MKIMKKLAVGMIATFAAPALLAENSLEQGVTAYLADDFAKA
jgi:hypothetical protein